MESLSAFDDIHTFWSQRWSGPKPGWHLNKINPHLEMHTDLLLGCEQDNGHGGSSIFVPLCGKSVDLAYLASHPKVSHVVGIDIVQAAAEQFAAEHPELCITEFSGGNSSDQCCEDEQHCEAVTVFDSDTCKLETQSSFHGKRISILIGDVFDLMLMPSDKRSRCLYRGVSSNLNQTNSLFDGIYDRGSMVAIDPSRRHDYITLVGSLLRSGAACHNRQTLYEAQQWVASVVLLDKKNETEKDADRDRWEARGVTEVYELVFLIRKKNE
eukprot:CCRYP_013782-RA/>CCRYP_013782-RA protein AED:0.05 eAED:0.04 QI:0/0/0/1/1/1/3/0/268